MEGQAEAVRALAAVLVVQMAMVQPVAMALLPAMPLLMAV
jgi:hypothetical protein